MATIHAIFSVNLVTLVRAFYLLSSSAILFVRLAPPLRDRFLDYGARQMQKKVGSSSDSTAASNAKPLKLWSRLLDSLAQLKVSHSRFSDFYCLSVLCSALWASQIYWKSDMLQTMGSFTPETRHVESPPAKIGLCFLLLAVQSLRRLHECITLSWLSKTSTSSMWIGHYLIGLAFYFFTNIAIFIEDIHTLHNHRSSASLFATRRPFPLLGIIAVAMFFIAAYKQHRYHAYLASLKKYTLPDQDAFRYIVAPHYAAECLIYLSLAVLDARPGNTVNGTMFCAFVFVVVNLAVTADGTKRWMLHKFPDRRRDVMNRWRLVPMVF